MDLGKNQIQNIEPLSKVSFINLNLLDLSYNLIENISVLNNVPFINLQILKLAHNNIKNLEILRNTSINKNRLRVEIDSKQNCLMLNYINNLNYKITVTY